MHKVKVVPGAMFHVGQGSLVGLTPEQAKPRRHKLEDAGDGVYRVKGDVQFKGGEEIAVPEIDKGQSHLVDVLKQDSVDDEQGFNTPKRVVFGKKR